MRDSLESVPPPETKDPVDALSTSLEKHVCISDPKATVRERVGEWLFEYNASSFFQTNNSVLKPLTDYVRDAIFPPDASGASTSKTFPQPTHLVDTYCGAGLFSITLSPYFDQIAGIELSRESIKAAQHNASLNNIPPSKITFREGDAADIFASVKADFDPSKTVLIIDPPRKGCDEWFLQQVLDFRCGTIVYVSCNVHTQARDVGILINRTKDDGEGRMYVLESLKGWDLFPQTAHVESVAVLRLV
jgi:tRNA (uracil-5-)-methyltransferase